MDSKEILDAYSMFDLDEQVFLFRLARFSRVASNQGICDDVRKILSLIRSLREVLNKAKPKNLPPLAILRHKRFLYLTSQGLNTILELSENKQVKALLQSQCDFIESAFYCIDEYDDICIDEHDDINTAESRVESLLLDVNEILSDAQKYTFADFANVICTQCKAS